MTNDGSGGLGPDEPPRRFDWNLKPADPQPPATGQVPPLREPGLEPDPSTEAVVDPGEATQAYDISLAGPDGPDPVGIPRPPGEAGQPSAIDALFGEHQFVEPTGASVPRRADRKSAEPREPRASLSKTQTMLLWVAGGLVGILALIGLFLLGTRLPGPVAAAPSATPTPTPTPTTPVTLPVGPLAPGVYEWDELLGGECLQPYESPWVEEFTVVDCTTPHAAQMVYRGVFADGAEVAYPGPEELAKRINLLCTPPTIIDYAVAGSFPDLQVVASFTANEELWSAGDRTFFCFVHRTAGQQLTSSVAVPAPPPA